MFYIHVQHGINEYNVICNSFYDLMVVAHGIGPVCTEACCFHVVWDLDKMHEVNKKSLSIM